LPLRIVEDDTGAIAAWAYSTSSTFPLQHNKALGIVDGDNLKGCVIFSGYNGSEAEVIFYGPGVFTRYLARTVARIALEYFDLNRLVIRTQKEALGRICAKLGGVYEGRQACVLGPSEGDEHAVHVWAFFRGQIKKVAGIKEQSPCL
jgi:hypothetical protein